MVDSIRNILSWYVTRDLLQKVRNNNLYFGRYVLYESFYFMESKAQVPSMKSNFASIFKASASKVAKFANTCNTQGWWEPVPMDPLLLYPWPLNLFPYLEGNLVNIAKIVTQRMPFDQAMTLVIRDSQKMPMAMYKNLASKNVHHSMFYNGKKVKKNKYLTIEDELNKCCYI